MAKRVLTGAVLILAVGAVIWVWRPWIEIVLALVMLLSFHEIFCAFRAGNARPVEWPGYLYALLCGFSAAFGDKIGIPALSGARSAFMWLVLAAMLAICAVVLRGKVDFDSLTASVFPLIYPGAFFAVFLWLPSLGERKVGTLAVLLAIFVASMNDCFALFAGMAFGKRKLSPQISPKKTVEGSVGGLIAAVLFAILLPLAVRGIAGDPGQKFPPLWTFAPVGLIAGAFSQIGDLTASLIKRHCGIKDFGKIFPGHGGVLDRLDGILFAAVPWYVFFATMGY
ncbi:MAG TPA: phosphatidate cytidylyltransferase [Candidatus Pullichristensenella excrementigallinarum]|uniref:Phosphatidate cytidylyltransferase n=1 Tax=Candidatus Pullichristensenella excrementigallinarum TaxID=2840907 RepID=A0A9D1IAQ4_9FIRM|nr:phosphatidate cytidylyltransferase [Candidatus Pullichristensenella excrementigallinarum]